MHVFAPGTDIASTIPGSRYAYSSGTSMACPHVSGLAALVLTMRDNLNATDVKAFIEDNVQKKEQYAGLVSSGGLINIAGTIRAVKKQGILHCILLHYMDS